MSYYPGTAFRISDAYGWRVDPRKNDGSLEFHSGIDFAAAAGTSIPAAYSGTVIYSSGKNTPNSTLGYVVIIKSTAITGSDTVLNCKS
jgi:murein DD-endopeptidase MepM/ murein hydrolase activator NlpD